ncbi:hypothetical protein PENSPDRAFT_236311 [Peniophora sp. CONT]|nr:hypothetical protein PENSPDRAFT_236311 [Peniophora sp. CONT]
MSYSNLTSVVQQTTENARAAETIMKVPWGAFLGYLKAVGFPASFLRSPGDGRPVATLPLRENNSHDCARFIISASYEWEIKPGLANIEALAVALQFSIPLPSAPTSRMEPTASVIPRGPDIEDISIYTILDEHRQNVWRSYNLLRTSPRQFLDVCRALLQREEVDSVQLWDLVWQLSQFAAQYSRSANQRNAIWDHLLEGGIVGICSSLLRHSDSLSILQCTVEILHGLVFWCVSDKTAIEHHPITALAAKRLFDEACATLWARRELLIDDSGESYLVYHAESAKADVVRGTILHMISLYTPVFTGEMTLGGDADPDACLTVCRVGLLSWMYPAPQTSSTLDKASFIGIIMSVLTTDLRALYGFTEADMRRFIQDDIVDRYGAEPVLCELAKVFHPADWPKLSAHLVRLMLQGIGEVVVHPAFRSHYVTSRLFTSLCAIIEEPRLQALDVSDRWTVQKFVLEVIRPILHKSSISQAAKPLIRFHNIFALVAQACFCFANAPTGHADDYLLDNVIGTYTIIARGAQARGRDRDGELFEMISRAVKIEWYPTVHGLRLLALHNVQAEPKCQQLITAWIKLGNVLGLQEEKEGVEYERERKRVAQLCAWRECEFHEKKPPAATRTCAGCSEVRYCSRECQQMDWKRGGHKQLCKRLKNEPHRARRS